MPLTIEALETQLDAIQTAKAAVLAAMATEVEDEKNSKWQVGEVRFDESSSSAQNLSEKLKQLIEAEKAVIEMMQNNFPSEVVVTVQSDIDEFGVDSTEYVGGT